MNSKWTRGDSCTVAAADKLAWSKPHWEAIKNHRIPLGLAKDEVQGNHRRRSKILMPHQWVSLLSCVILELGKPLSAPRLDITLNLMFNFPLFCATLVNRCINTRATLYV
jgi:hypothetical protein